MSQDGGHEKSTHQASDPLIGQVLNDRFEIVRLIGRGGLGAVYLANQAPFDRRCAVKVLRPRYEGDAEDFHRRFFLEASTAAKLRHPNNVTVFDYGRTDDGMYFMAMEYLEGRTLRQAMRREGPFDEERTTHIARQICRALREAHHHDVVHRDIKPANIFLLDRHDETDVVKVLDFGLVKEVAGEEEEDLTQAGQFVGSPKYVAPEQIQGTGVDGRTDIYALGVVMYEMLAGRVPFDGGATVKTLIAHIKQELVPLRQVNPACEVSELIEQTVYRCLAKDPADRFASMDDLLGVLKQVGAGPLTGSFLGDSGQSYLDSGPSGVSGSVPQPTTVTPPTGSGSDAIQLAQAGATGAPPVSRPSLARRYAKTAIASVAGIAAVGATVYMTGRQGSEHAVTPAVRSAPASAERLPGASVSEETASAPVREAPAEPAPERFVRIETTPAKAKVQATDGTTLCEKSPCRVSAGDIGDGGMTVKVSAPGFFTKELEVSPDEEQVSIRLRRIPARPKPKPTATGTVPKGYKGDPFGEMPPY